MVIEGVLTTENADGSMHVSPIGPHVNEGLSAWTLKPFQSSATFINLRASSRAVFHVVDDPLLMAASVLGLCNVGEKTAIVDHFLGVDELMRLTSSQFKAEIGWVLDLGCRYFALAVAQWDISTPRAVATCSLSMQEDKRPFWGWNRARHSILELSILASRVHMLERAVIEEELKRHQNIIEKTAGTREIVAWELLKKHLSQ